MSAQLAVFFILAAMAVAGAVSLIVQRHPIHSALSLIVVMAALWVLVERTAVGQEIQAVGGNPIAARLAGIGVDRIKILGFVISGVCAALTGTLLASRLGSGTTSAADSYLLTAFAAVFLGSATLRDGVRV